MKPGQGAEFERWAHDITEASARYPGHLGASWVRTAGAYHVIYRFADHALFQSWHDSAERAGFLERLQPIATLVTDEHVSGLETWFELPGQPGKPAPPRWKMLIATWIGVFPLLGLLHWQVAPRLPSVPLILRVMLFTLVVVSLMTYLVMPRLTLLLRSWLYPST